MTSSVIHYNFRSDEEETKLTAPVLTKGRRYVKTMRHVSNGLKALCILVNVACIALSVFVVAYLCHMG